MHALRRMEKGPWFPTTPVLDLSSLPDWPVIIERTLIGQF